MGDQAIEVLVAFANEDLVVIAVILARLALEGPDAHRR